MDFAMGKFVKNGLMNAIGKQADYWVILNAAGWMEKNVLNEADLAEIQAAINAKNERENAVAPANTAAVTDDATPEETDIPSP